MLILETEGRGAEGEFVFRTRETFLGPVADAVPSTPIFEMYPIGMTSLAAFLERNHYNVEIVNLAYRMLQDRALDAAALIARLEAPVFGIDLHWLPHVQGALAVALQAAREDLLSQGTSVDGRAVARPLRHGNP